MAGAVTAPGRVPVRTALGVVAVAVLVAVAADLALYGLGRAAGGSFVFTAPAGATRVDAATVAGFAALPLLVGLALAVLLARRWPRVLGVGQVAAPVLALGTVPLMTLPADLDAVSTVALALGHVVLVPVSVLALRALRGDPG
ncbi:hypothetical protein SAMN04488543_0403 [Friedmanniella luteola]|uniref:Uncharacterized protein n=1 Tax=Friedmanniella luteola TaxID=546871 RepID=A0A1H1LTQ0_9ACTN|nr:hypothetical protein SAMN04488543_0403 [Friedmanniella luteola]